jgi:hypothetical protein
MGQDVSDNDSIATLRRFARRMVLTNSRLYRHLMVVCDLAEKAYVLPLALPADIQTVRAEAFEEAAIICDTRSTRCAWLIRAHAKGERI